jgi:hypothetical protein
MDGTESNKEDTSFIYIRAFTFTMGWIYGIKKNNFSERAANCENVKLMGDGWN